MVLALNDVAAAVISWWRFCTRIVPAGEKQRGGGCTRIMHGGILKTMDPRVPTNSGGTEHIGLPPTRQKLLARSRGEGRGQGVKGF